MSKRLIQPFNNFTLASNFFMSETLHLAPGSSRAYNRRFHNSLGQYQRFSAQKTSKEINTSNSVPRSWFIARFWQVLAQNHVFRWIKHDRVSTIQLYMGRPKLVSESLLLTRHVKVHSKIRARSSASSFYNIRWVRHSFSINHVTRGRD